MPSFADWMLLFDEDLDEAVFELLSREIDWENEEEILRTLSQVKRAIFVTSVLEGQVGNGGFVQYFYNTGGLHVPYLQEEITLIGARSFLAIVQRALAVYADHAALFEQAIDTDNARQDFGGFGSLYDEPALEELMALTWQFLDTEQGSLLGFRVELIRRHLEEFVPRPSSE